MYGRILILLLATIGLTACAKPTPSDMLETYAARVGNAIGEPIQLDLDTALRNKPALPHRRDRLIAIAPIREGLIDVLDFRHCGLLREIAERNSSLGKLATSSQRLIYELHILPEMRRCRILLATHQIDAPTRLATRLNQVIAQKRASLPALIWNAIYTSPEMEQQFALRSPPLPLQGQGLLAPITPALTHFAQLAELSTRNDWNTPPFTDNLEQDYAALYRSHFGAEWLTSIVLLTRTLERTADAIERRLARRPICFNHTPNNQARILRNVFELFYAGQLQPYLSLVHRQGQQWLQLQQQIVAHLPTPAASQHYFSQVLNPNTPDGIWQRYLRARDRHTKAWQRQLDQCGMMPGSS